MRFIGDGAQRVAIFYSFFAYCKLHGVDPGEWLLDVMRRLAEHPVNQIEQLLPHRWKRERENWVTENQVVDG